MPKSGKHKVIDTGVTAGVTDRFNPRTLRTERWEKKKCTGKGCSAVFEGRAFEVLCPRCEQLRRNKFIKEVTKLDDWHPVPGGYVRKQHLGD